MMKLVVTFLLLVTFNFSNAGVLRALEDVAKASREARSVGIGIAAARGEAAADKIAALSKASLHGLNAQEVVQLAGIAGQNALYLDFRGSTARVRSVESGVTLAEGNNLDQLLNEAKIRLPSPHFVITKRNAVRLGNDIAELTSVGSVSVMDPDMGLLELVHVTSGKNDFYLKLRPGLLVELKSKLHPELASILSSPAKVEDLHVVSLFSNDDADSIAGLAKAAGDRLIPLDAFVKNVESSIRRHRGKTLVIVGHIENDKFVVRRADGSSLYSIELEKIQKAADSSDVTLISAGCSSYCAKGAIGFLSPVTDRGVASGISRMFAAKDYGDLLSAFGAAEPIVISDASLQAFSRTHFIDLKRLKREDTAGRTSSYLIRMFGRARSAGFSGDGSPGWWAFWAVFMFAAVGLNKKAFDRCFPRLPSPLLHEQRLRYAVLLLLRSVGFVALSPLFLVFALLSLFIGFTHFRKVIDGSWNFVRDPALLYFLCYVAAFIIILIPELILLTNMENDTLSSFRILDLFICIVYLPVSISVALLLKRWISIRYEHDQINNRLQP